MLNFRGNQIWRGNEKIGWIDGHHLFDHEGHKIASWDGDELFDGQGNRMLQARNNALVTPDGRIHGHLSDALEAVPSMEHPQMARVAIHMFLGG